MIGMALDTSDHLPRLAMLMHDRSADLVPPGDDLIASAQHGVFIRHLAIMACREPDCAATILACTRSPAVRCLPRRRRLPMNLPG